MNGIITEIQDEFTQAYESDTLAKNVCQELSDHITGTRLVDGGQHEFDEFHWTKLQRIRAGN